MRKTNSILLHQLIQLLSQLDDHQYAKPLDILSQNTIGKHVRHILEFYQCLLKGIENRFVDYDDRERDLDLENFTKVAIEASKTCIAQLKKLPKNQPLQLAATLPQERIALHTNTERELLYVMEHTVHHFAIIKIALLHDFPTIQVAEGFGVAYATLQYQEQLTQS